MRRTLAAGAAALALAWPACRGPRPDPAALGSSAARLKPVTAAPAEPSVRRTVYVPVYSSLYLGLEAGPETLELAATLSIRNTSVRHPVALEFVRYYDSEGALVREYLERRSELGPLASVEYVIRNRDTAGGPGAKFLVGWTGAAGMDEPLIEAIMIGQKGSAGWSFTTSGRVVEDEPGPASDKR